ncbi:MAG: hypothetical protein QM604_10000 [Microbacterium sp.]
MTWTLILLLLLNAVYNAVVWPRFFRRIARDPRARDRSGRRTAFYTVHAVLIGAALLLALVSAVVAVIAIVTVL